MVTNAPLRRPHHLLPEWVIVPGPSHHQTTTKTAITVGITVRNLLQAVSPPGGVANAPRGKREAQGGVQPVTCIQVKLAAWSWTESATCSGKGSTKSGVRNI